MWHELIGVPRYYSGAAGSITLGSGEIVHIVSVHASAGSATWTLFGGSAIPVINGANPVVYQFYHTLYKGNAINTIVFTNTDHYFVHTIILGNYASFGGGFG